MRKIPHWLVGLSRSSLRRALLDHRIAPASPHRENIATTGKAIAHSGVGSAPVSSYRTR